MSPAPADALVFYGATGDLAFKKIFPALQRMAQRGVLDVPVIGVAKQGWALPDLVARARESVAKHGGGVDEAAFGRPARLLRYVDGDYAEEATFAALRRALGPARLPVHYLAIPQGGEIVIGIIIPAVLFLTPRFNRNPALLVLGGLCAVIGVVINRWNVTVSGLFVPLAYSPGTQYVLPPGSYFPNLYEWGIALGIIGYALGMLTLGVMVLPLFGKKEHAYPKRLVSSFILDKPE